MRHAPLLGAAASLCLVLGAAACGGDNTESEEEIVNQLSESLQNGGEGFDPETADCFAQIVVEEVGVEEVQDLDLTADEPPEELQEEIAAAAIRATEDCDLAGASG